MTCTNETIQAISTLSAGLALFPRLSPPLPALFLRRQPGDEAIACLA